MRIAVTGASGFIGTALVPALAEAGHDLIGISRGGVPSGLGSVVVGWHRIDVGCDDARDRLAHALDGVDTVVHLAWTMQPRSDPGWLWSRNVLGSATVAAAASTVGVAHLVHMSSSGVYTPHRYAGPVGEAWPASGTARSSYSTNKAAAETRVARATRTLPTAVLRPALVIGAQRASEVTRYVLGRFIAPWLAHPDHVVVPWPAGMTVQLVGRDDVVDAVCRVVEQRATGAFNLAADPPIDAETMHAVCRRVSPGLPTYPIPEETWSAWARYLQPRDAGWLAWAMRGPLVRTDRARAGLGWQPQRSAVRLLETFLAELATSARHAVPRPAVPA